MKTNVTMPRPNFNAPRRDDGPQCAYPTGSVRAQLACLGVNLGTLAESIGELKEKLSPVIQDRSDSGEITGDPRDNLCAVGNDVRDKADRVTELNGIVRSIIDQLDV